MWSSACLAHLAVTLTAGDTINVRPAATPAPIPAPAAARGKPAAHSLPTHARITSAVVAHTITNGLVCSEPERARVVLDSLLQIGTIKEDDWAESIDMVKEQIKQGTGRDVSNEFLLSLGQSSILGRFNFHFTPKLDYTESTCSSLDWAFGNQPCSYLSLVPEFLVKDWAHHTGDSKWVKVTLRNQFTWDAAVAQAKQPAGNTGFAQGFASLGYVLHLLEDLTSPPHSRNDAHGPDDADWMEYRMPASIKEGFEKITSLSLLPDEAVRAPVMPANRPLPPEAIEPRALFVEVNNYVRANFYSKSTVAFTAPGPIANDDQATSCQSVKGVTWARYICDPKGRVVAKGNFPIERTPGVILQSRAITWPTQLWTDAWVADEQWRELGPVAVRAGSRLLMLYVRKAQPLMPCTIK